jgi:hypothetical protein
MDEGATVRRASKNAEPISLFHAYVLRPVANVARPSSLVFFVAVPILLALLLLLGGRFLLDQIRGQDRYRVDFMEIECAAPAGGSRAEFLSEVRYLSEFPERVPLLEDGLTARLARAFARHPWVEKVEEVKIEPPRRILVQLQFRQPVLAVAHGDELRAVDRHGILLPTDAVTEGLPRYPEKAPPPHGPAGTPWGDQRVEAAARQAMPR